MKVCMESVKNCWVCGCPELVRDHEGRFDLSDFADRDPELFEYTNRRFWLSHCQQCGFMQPEELPTLPYFFQRLYERRHSMQLHVEESASRTDFDEMQRDFSEGSKDFIFHAVLRRLEERVPKSHRTLLDIGSHVGRFMYLATQRGWIVEGVEPNPETAAFAAARTGCRVHQIGASAVKELGARFSAVALTDVLEHIPRPLDALGIATSVLAPGGCIAVKVPSAPSQIIKERVRARLKSNYEFAIARNMYHVGHFSQRSLFLAFQRIGLENIQVTLGAPELFMAQSLYGRLRSTAPNFVRLAGYYFGLMLPGGERTWLAMNLLALGNKPGQVDPDTRGVDPSKVPGMSQ